MSWQNIFLSLLLRARVKPLTTGKHSVQHVRRIFATLPVSKKIPRGWRIRAETHRDIAGEWIERDGGNEPDSNARTILYLHGGAYMFCSPQTHRPLTLALAQHSDARLFAPDYRLAPEHPFPAALDDAVAAYRHLLGQGVRPESLILAGDSAGGGLALATLLALKQADEPMPAGAVLFSPWTDLAATGESIRSNTGWDVLVHGRSVAKGALYYLGDTDPRNPLASPLYGDLAGLPPLLVQASTSEVLRDDSTRLAERARAAGVEAEITLWQGLPHVWQFFTPFLPEADAALTEAAEFITRWTA